LDLKFLVVLGILCAIALVTESLSQAIDLILELEDGVGSRVHLDEAALRCRVLVVTDSRVDGAQYLNFGANIVHGVVDRLHSGLVSKQIFSNGLEVGFVLVLSNL
jgi:hypothetical protein